MTLDEMKIAVLQLIEPDTNFNVDDISTYEEDDNYTGYLSSVVSSFNRAVSRIVALDKLPYKLYSLAYITEDTTITTNNEVFNLNTLISDLNDVKNVFIDGNVIDYRLENNYLYVPKTQLGTYEIFYSFIPTPITESFSADLTTLGIPNNILAIIPYYIKADIYHDLENATLSTSARNFFEEYLSSINNNKSKGNFQNVVKQFWSY